MALPRDPETLKIPAFMRKRNISSRLKKPLILTALDRKKAGLLPEGLKRAVKIKPAQKKKSAPRPKLRIKNIFSSKTFSEPVLEKFTEPSFIEPIIEPIIQPARLRQKKIGVITHYYDKIKVGVIKLSGTLCVGDCIKYETFDGRYEQVVESMEIDRNPVFKACKGKEIGLKLSRLPRIGSIVLK